MSCSNNEHPARRQSSLNVTVNLCFKHSNRHGEIARRLSLRGRVRSSDIPEELNMDLLLLIQHLEASVGRGVFSIPVEYISREVSAGSSWEDPRTHSRGFCFPSDLGVVVQGSGPGNAKNRQVKFKRIL